MGTIADYRIILRDRILEKKEQVSREFTYQNLAQACRIQKTYLTKVFKGEAHLSDDQLFLACEYLGFDREGYQEMTLLHAYERSGQVKRRQMLAKEIVAHQKKSQRSNAHIGAKTSAISSEFLTQYYLTPDMQLIHMFLTIDRYARNIDLIGEQLNLSLDRVIELVRVLEAAGIVDLEEGCYHVKESRIHLEPESVAYEPYRILQKLRSLEQLRKLPVEDRYSFNVVFSADQATRRTIHQKFLHFLGDIEKDVVNAPAQEVFQMSFDLFGWG